MNPFISNQCGESLAKVFTNDFVYIWLACRETIRRPEELGHRGVDEEHQGAERQRQQARHSDAAQPSRTVEKCLHTVQNVDVLFLKNLDKMEKKRGVKVRE